MQLTNVSPGQQRAEQHVEQGGQKASSAPATSTPALTPQSLSERSFLDYPPQAREMSTRSLPLLRTIPLPLLPLLLREMMAFDYRFPRERERIVSQLSQLQAMDTSRRERLLSAFQGLELPPSLAAMNWVSDPGQYLDALTAVLWSSGQMPQFRAAAKSFIEALPDAQDTSPRHPRQAIIVLDKSLQGPPALRKLRSQGVTVRIADRDGWTALLQHLRDRANAHPAEYAHWYIDGAAPRFDLPQSPIAQQGATIVSYDALAPVRDHLLSRARDAMSAERSGPEQLRTLLMQTTPEQMGMSHSDSVLTHFQLSLLTEGSGTQIFSTTFVQWAARECLRRAEPSTLLLRFTPRQAQQGMNEMLSGAPQAGLDPAGSLIDAEQGALYTWINLRRLPAAEKASCLVWHEASGQAVVVGPGIAAGTHIDTVHTMQQALQLLS